ncbi:uncharacterized protein LOC109831135 [Asparagus officinalis]|nr:uncharacterized protein LOC109831135 [Asparagus officinalis]
MSGHIYSWRASYVYAHVVVVLESSKRKTKGVIFSNHSICFIRELYLLELYCQDKRNHANIKVIEVNHIRLWARQPLCTVMIRRCNTSSISGTKRKRLKGGREKKTNGEQNRSYFCCSKTLYFWTKFNPTIRRHQFQKDLDKYIRFALAGRALATHYAVLDATREIESVQKEPEDLHGLVEPDVGFGSPLCTAKNILQLEYLLLQCPRTCK